LSTNANNNIPPAVRVARWILVTIGCRGDGSTWNLGPVNCLDNGDNVGIFGSIGNDLIHGGITLQAERGGGKSTRGQSRLGVLGWPGSDDILLRWEGGQPFG